MTQRAAADLLPDLATAEPGCFALLGPLERHVDHVRRDTDRA
jgi:hypothetical protein